MNLEDELGFQCNSDEDVVGIDATPSISKDKVQPFLKFNAATADGAEVPKVSISSNSKNKTTAGSTVIEDQKKVLIQYI